MPHRDELDGVVFVDEHRERIDGNFELGGFVSVLFLEGIDFGPFHWAAHGSELSGAFDQGGRCGGGAFTFDLDFHVRVERAEAFGPEGHEVIERIGPDGVELAGDSGDGFVLRQGGIHFSGLCEDLRRDGCGGQRDGGGEDRSAVHRVFHWYRDCLRRAVRHSSQMWRERATVPRRLCDNPATRWV